MIVTVESCLSQSQSRLAKMYLALLHKQGLRVKPFELLTWSHNWVPEGYAPKTASC